MQVLGDGGRTKAPASPNIGTSNEYYESHDGTNRVSGNACDAHVSWLPREDSAFTAPWRRQGA
jgi:hypothetical protein